VAEIEKEFDGIGDEMAETMELIPERGDIWWVALGSEVRKTRPCVVVSVKVLMKGEGR